MKKEDFYKEVAEIFRRRGWMQDHGLTAPTMSVNGHSYIPFKVGDRVRIIKPIPVPLGMLPVPDEEGIITDVWGVINPEYRVTFRPGEFNQASHYVTADYLELATKKSTAKCTCGVDSVGEGFHSSWCDKAGMA